MKGLVFTYALVAIGAIGSLRRPVLGLWIYVGFSVLRPASLWSWAGDLSGVSQIVGVAMLIGWAFHGFGSWKFMRGRSIAIALVAFGVWSSMSALQAKEPAMSVAHLSEFAKMLLPFFVGITMMNSEKDASKVLWIIVLAQAYVSLEMNLSYLNGFNQARDEGFGGMDNNSFGISLVTAFGAGVALLLGAKTWPAKATAAIAVALILHTTLLTFSRGAFVGLVAVGVMAVAIMPKRPKYIGAVILIALLAIRLTGPELAARYTTTISPEEGDTSVQSRWALWQDCLEVVAARPVFGVGPLNFGLVAPDFGWPAGKQAHSVWLQTAAEVGIPGVLALMLFYGLAISRLWPVVRSRSPDTDQTTKMLAAAVVMAVVGFAVSAQFVSLEGLEMPFYIVMAGVVLLKTRSQLATSVAPSVLPSPAPVGLPGRVGQPVISPRRTS